MSKKAGTAVAGDADTAREQGTTNAIPHAWVNAAVEVMIETGRCSSTALGRRLKLTPGQVIGLMDELEARDIVGGPNGEQPRQILIDLKKDWKPLAVDANADKKRTRQQMMEGPGFNAKRIDEIDEAAETYRHLVQQRMKLNDKEAEAKGALMALMHSHKLENYSFENDDGESIHVWLEKSDETVKVKAKAKKEGEKE